MIFLSLGTHEQPFSRAVELVRPLAEAGEEILIQHGFTDPDLSVPNATWERFLDYGRMVDALQESNAFVCHAGVGSVLTALMHGITPVILPRQERHGEHVDDHQLQLATKLADRNLVVLVEGDNLTAAIERAGGMRGQPRGHGENLLRAVAHATSRRATRSPRSSGVHAAPLYAGTERSEVRQPVAHFGPDPAFVGGMSSVMRMMHEHQIGGVVTVWPSWEPALRWPLVFGRAVLRLMRLPRGTIVHVHVSQRGSVLRKAVLLLLARSRGLRRVATIHGSGFGQEVQQRPAAVRHLLRQANVVVCLTDEAAQLCRRLAPESDIAIIPNPARLAANVTPADETRPIVLFAGEAGMRKGIDVLSAAWAEVVSHVPEGRCVVLGPLTDFEPDPDSGMEFLGPVGFNDVVQWLAQARVVVLPSRAEAMPMILLEAMGAGRPFIATPVGRIPELAADGGRLVPVGDASSLAEEIVLLLENPSMAKEIGDRGRRRCVETRSPAVIDGLLADVYRRAKDEK